MSRLPAKITGFRAETINAIIDCLRELRPIDGPTIGHEFTGRGVTPKVRGLPGYWDFPWDEVLFGHSIAGNVFTVKPGEVHYKTSIFTCPTAGTDTPLTISADLTYVYVEMEWGTGAASIKQHTNKVEATTSSSHFRKWLYLLNYTASGRVTVKTYGHTGGAISIMPVY